MSNGGSGIGGGAASTGTMAVIELLADGPRLKALYLEYDEKMKSFQEIIGKVGPAQDVAQLRESLRVELQNVPSFKAKAQEEADAIVEDARHEAANIKAEAGLIKEAAKSAAARKATDATATLAEASSKLDAVLNRELDQQKKQVEQDTREGELNTGFARLEQAQEKLAADRARLEETLAKAQELLK